ncbi:hypothetical protein D3C76_1508250 [compost metagenome]
MQPSIIRACQPIGHVLVLQIVFADTDLDAFRRSINMQRRAVVLFLLFALFGSVPQISLLDQFLPNLIDIA